MWFPFATDLPCLHCEAVQSTWSYMSVMCLAFLGFALAAGCLFTRISFFLDSVFPFSALFGSVDCSHLVFTVGQQLPEATGLILTWPRLSAGLRLVWRNLNRLQCRHLHISRHNDMPLPSRATTYNALCWKISQLVFGVFLNSNQPDPTKPPSLSSPSLTSTRPACQSNSHCKLQHHPVGGSHNAMVKIRFLCFGL